MDTHSGKQGSTEQQLLQSATQAAQLAADHINSVERPPEPSIWGDKGTRDFVTQVDRECERLITESLLESHPGSVVIGEELSPVMGDMEQGVTWVVDPLDGTTNYLHQYEAYAVSIGAIADGEPAAGVIVDVARSRTYSCTAGGGAWCNDEKLQVSSINDPKLALIGTGFPFKMLELLPRYLEQFTTVLSATSGIRRGGAAALDLADIASGRLDGFWELSLAPWDVAAGTLLVREAGGLVTDFSGGQNVIRQGPVVAGNRAIHEWLLDILR